MLGVRLLFAVLVTMTTALCLSPFMSDEDAFKGTIYGCVLFLLADSFRRHDEGEDK
jgi:hypothetical protein